MATGYSDEELEAEKKFLPHLTEFLRKINHIDERMFLRHWALLSITEDMTEDNGHANGWYPSEGFPLAYQLGCLNYTSIQMDMQIRESEPPEGLG